MNNKKKGSNPNLNNFINTNFMSNNNNFNSAKKIENSPVKFSNQMNNANINNVNLTMKPKRQLDNLINNHNFPSGNNENSENFLKNNFNNIDFLALANKNDEEASK